MYMGSQQNSHHIAPTWSTGIYVPRINALRDLVKINWQKTTPIYANAKQLNAFIWWNTALQEILDAWLQAINTLAQLHWELLQGYANSMMRAQLP